MPQGWMAKRPVCSCPQKLLDVVVDDGLPQRGTNALKGLRPRFVLPRGIRSIEQYV